MARTKRACSGNVCTKARPSAQDGTGFKCVGVFCAEQSLEQSHPLGWRRPPRSPNTAHPHPTSPGAASPRLWSTSRHGHRTAPCAARSQRRCLILTSRLHRSGGFGSVLCHPLCWTREATQGLLCANGRGCAAPRGSAGSPFAARNVFVRFPNAETVRQLAPVSENSKNQRHTQKLAPFPFMLFLEN